MVLKHGRAMESLLSYDQVKQGSYRSWKIWKVVEFKNFIFKAWKVMEFNFPSLKVMEN